MITQGRLSKMQEKETNITTTLISIQSMFLPHMEVLKHELSIVENLMQRDANISTKVGLVDLVAQLEFQLHSLEVAKNNWIVELVIFEQVHKTFLDK